MNLLKINDIMNGRYSAFKVCNCDNLMGRTLLCSEDEPIYLTYRLAGWLGLLSCDGTWFADQG